MIQNNTFFRSNKKFQDAIKILNEGLTYADPQIGLSRYFSKNKIKTTKSTINLKEFENVYLVAIGKAADSMAKFVSSQIVLKSGIVVLPSDYKPIFTTKKIRFFRSGHPLPNLQSLRAGKYIQKFVDSTTKNDFIIFLISGGGSSLVTIPYGITLEEKICVNHELIHCGAKINEISCVRKHISDIKGGKLIQRMQSSGISFILSDVISDDLLSLIHI